MGIVEGGGASVGGVGPLQKFLSLQHCTAFRWAFGEAWWQTIGLPGGTSWLFSKHLLFPQCISSATMQHVLLLMTSSIPVVRDTTHKRYSDNCSLPRCSYRRMMSSWFIMYSSELIKWEMKLNEQRVKAHKLSTNNSTRRTHLYENIHSSQQLW